MRVGFTFEGATSTECRCPHRPSRSPTASGSSSAIADKIVEVGEHNYVLHYRATRADRALQRTMTNSTGTRPATAGSSRSTRLSRGSACPQPVRLGQRAFYTGPEGSTASNAEVMDEKPGEITFRTTQPLGGHEGLTVAVAFPKGVVAEPAKSARNGWSAVGLRSAGAGRLRRCLDCSVSIFSPGAGPDAIRARGPSCRCSRRPTA